MTQRVFLLATGAFNPPTIMHLRMMELARDHLRKLGFNVIGGAMTPVHDGYGKKGLAPAKHRLKMCQLALQTNDWIKLSSWEAAKNSSWVRTRVVAEYHENVINEYINGTGEPSSIAEWLPDSGQSNESGPVQLKLVCGADYLESFNIKDLWMEEDMTKLVGDYGFVVITREGNNILQSIWNNDVLNKYQRNIHIVHEWIKNDISSTKIRMAIRRSESIRYLVADPVEEYIKTENLYVSSQ